MGVPTGKHVHAGPRDGPHRRAHRRQAPPRDPHRRGVAARLIPALALAALLATPAAAETFRIATWHADLSRDGPGLLLRDLSRGEERADAVVDGLAALRPDIVLLTDIDWDHGHAALGVLQDRLAAAGLSLPHALAPRPNAGMATGLDLDGDGRTGGPRDAQGYGRFTGQGGMALLSRWPFVGEVRDFSALLWRDLPGALLVLDDGAPLLSDAAAAVQRLSSTGHWAVPVETPAGRLTLLAMAAGPPVFDGPEDRNGRRNHDEVTFWRHFLAGAFGPPPEDPVILLGLVNLDPADGDGRRAAIRDLLSHPRLQDPRPTGPGGAAAAATQAGPNLAHAGDPALDTADFREDGGPGNLRVSYVLPDAAFTVADAGVAWPSGEAGPLRHHMVWVDLRLQRGP
jgi:hypothetical protein